MKSFALILFLTFTMCAEAKNCAVYLAENNITVSGDPTENLIAFLSELYQKRTLNNQHILNIANSNFENPLKINASFDSDHIIFLEIYDELLIQADKNKLQNWAAIFVKDKKLVQEEKDQSKKGTEKSAVKMKFHRIDQGSFTIKINSGDYRTVLTTPFEMMSTSVTNKMWKDLMGQHTITDKEDGEDYPVNMLTWWSAIVYANRLSKRDNLPEVYDLSAIKDWKGSAAEGTYQPLDGIKAARAIKINAVDGDIYKAKGYRLPTHAESIFVNMDRGRSNTKTFTDITEEKMIRHAWSLEHNIEANAVMPVAELLPFIIDGNSFYDLYGNVHEWLHDMGYPMSSLASSTNPVSFIKGLNDSEIIQRYIKSNSHWTSSNEMYSWRSTKLAAEQTNLPVSFRLVRSLEK